MRLIKPRNKLDVHGRRRQRQRQRRRGTEVLELALLLPLLLALGLFACQFAYYFYIQHNAQAAAREGARAGIPFGATQADAETRVEGYLTSSGLDPADFTIEFSTDPGTAAPGTDITVTVEGNWSDVGIDLNGWGPISSDKVIRGRAVMRKEG
jgi:Flp pilus assembly protein TadG